MEAIIVSFACSNDIFSPWASSFKIADIAERDIGDLRKRLTRQKSLVAGNYHVWEGRETFEHIVLDDG
jgi:hypothetical protein